MATETSTQMELDLEFPPVTRCEACGKMNETHRMKQMPDHKFVCIGSCEDTYKENVYAFVGF